MPLFNFKREKQEEMMDHVENKREEVREAEIVVTQSEKDYNNVINIPSKLEKDKITLDLVTAVNQYIKSRQLSQQEIALLEAKLSESMDQINLLKGELSRANEIILERDKQIANYEKKLVDKNLMIDQMIEDNNEIRSTLSNEISELKSLLSIEQKKYKKLTIEAEQENRELANKIREHEEKIRQLESEKASLAENYNKLREENRYLMNMINDFTNRMSSSFSFFNKGNLKD